MINELLQPAIIISILALAIRYSTPIIMSAFGEAIAQRAGILNLGVEGTMLTGAFVGFVVAEMTGSLWAGVLGALIAGGLLGFLMVFTAATLKTDQVVTSLSINLLASGGTLYAYRTIYSGASFSSPPFTEIFSTFKIPLLSEIPFIGEILFTQQPLTYIALLMGPLIWFFLYRTRYGLIIRSIGENPRAAEMQGIRISRYQYLAVIAASMISGVAGSFLTLGSSARFIQNITQGRGWLVIVIVIAGKWHPLRILLAGLLFGLIDALQFQIQGIGVRIPYQFLLMLPYIAAIVVMMGSRARADAPHQLGIPYHRE
jgi:general nucleoside transport system permease protein